MPREIVTEVDIDATATTVWKKLVALRHWSDWNPFITRAEGNVEIGQKLSLEMHPPGLDPIAFQPTVTGVVVEQEIRWVGRRGMPGIFDGEHVFLIEPAAGAKTRLIHKETFSGLLVPFQWKKIEGPIRQGFEAMNAALKEAAEGSAPNS